MKNIASFDARDTVVGMNVVLKGILTSPGNIQINGEVEGEIHADGDVILGTSASVYGPISAMNVLIGGEVHGPIAAGQEVEILETGKIYGDIVAKKLSIHPGAIFIGKSTMPEETVTNLQPISEI
jgi:cytoskeletal protein CcmA (bactofilin family)